MCNQYYRSKIRKLEDEAKIRKPLSEEELDKMPDCTASRHIEKLEELIVREIASVGQRKKISVNAEKEGKSDRISLVRPLEKEAGVQEMPEEKINKMNDWDFNAYLEKLQNKIISL